MSGTLLLWAFFTIGEPASAARRCVASEFPTREKEFSAIREKGRLLRESGSDQTARQLIAWVDAQLRNEDCHASRLTYIISGAFHGLGAGGGASGVSYLSDWILTDKYAHRIKFTIKGVPREGVISGLRIAAIQGLAANGSREAQFAIAKARVRFADNKEFLSAIDGALEMAAERRKDRQDIRH